MENQAAPGGGLEKSDEPITTEMLNELFAN